MPPARAHDLLLVVGIDETQLNTQIAALQRRLSTSVTAPPALVHGLDQAAAAAGRVVQNLGAVNDAQAQVSRTVDATRRAQERLGADTVAINRRTLQDQAELHRSIGRTAAAREAGYRQMQA